MFRWLKSLFVPDAPAPDAPAPVAPPPDPPAPPPVAPRVRSAVRGAAAVWDAGRGRVGAAARGDAARRDTIDGWAFAAETELVWGDSGALSHATGSAVMTLAGVRCAAGETVVFEFGRLREAYPDEDGVLDEIPYQRGEIVRFHDHGRVARCYLAKDTVRSGVPCMAGARVYLDALGGLIEGTLATDCALCEIPVAEGTLVHLSSRAVRALTPRVDCVIDGIPCAAGVDERNRGEGSARSGDADDRRRARRDAQRGRVTSCAALTLGRRFERERLA